MTPMNCKVRYFSVGRIGNGTVLLTIMKSNSVSPCIAPYRSPYPFPTLGCEDCACCRTNSSTNHRNSRWTPRLIVQSELVPCLPGGPVLCQWFLCGLTKPVSSNGRFGDYWCTLCPLLRTGSCFRQNGASSVLTFTSTSSISAPTFVDQTLHSLRSVMASHTAKRFPKPYKYSFGHWAYRIGVRSNKPLGIVRLEEGECLLCFQGPLKLRLSPSFLIAGVRIWIIYERQWQADPQIGRTRGQLGEQGCRHGVPATICHFIQSPADRSAVCAHWRAGSGSS